MSAIARLVPVVGLALLAACSREASNPAPPRVTTPQPIPAQSSCIAMPIAARLADLEKLINDVVPHTLAIIEEDKRACVKLPVVGGVACHLDGEVTRGHIRVAGVNDALTLAIPVAARVSASDIGNLIKLQTATASAEINAGFVLPGSATGNPTPRST